MGTEKVRVKICGITNPEDGIVAAEAGADLLGFVFYPKSPRYVTPERAREIIAGLRDAARSSSSLTAAGTIVAGTRFVGVFVDEPVENVRRIMDQCGLDLAQLHGSEPPAEVKLLAPRAYKALRPKHWADVYASVGTYRDAVTVRDDRPAFLIDAYHPWKFGGTGEEADRRAARMVAAQFPILLAGGLTPENVAAAIAYVEPWGVDVSTGVESAPGKKDAEKVRAFIAAASHAEDP